jgi:hypothetical protein
MEGIFREKEMTKEGLSLLLTGGLVVGELKTL